MPIRRILIAVASLLGTLAIAGTTTGAVAVAGPQPHSVSQRAVAPEHRVAPRPDARMH